MRRENTQLSVIPPPAPGDADLVAGVADGREAALAEIFRRHSGAVVALALRVTRDRTLAEEIAQEVFLRLWRRPERFDPGRGSLRSFLLADTHGRAVDVIRSEAARRTREDRESRLVAESGPSIEEEVVEMQMAEHVRRAMDRLPTGERAAIELAYFGGHSYRDVARLLGEPEGTVKSRIRLGLRRMHDLLRADGVPA
jgi:RNA polymerase sigma-70 factor (ECF subfamily)